MDNPAALSTATNYSFRVPVADGQARYMTYPSAPLRLCLRAPADVLAAVPYLLGFHPAESLVVLGMYDTALVFHARCDLPRPDAPPDEVAALAGYIRDVVRAQDVNGVLLAGFGPTEHVTGPLMVTADAVRSAGIKTLDQLRAHSGRYWSYRCGNPACCPPEGKPYEVSSTVIAAEATLAGCVALPDRDALVRTLGPPTGPALAAMRCATASAERRLKEIPEGQAAARGQLALQEAIDRHAAGGRLTDDEVAWLTVLLAADQCLRDDALIGLEKERTAEARRKVHDSLWTDIVRRCDPHHVVTPAVLLAYVCWRGGDGVRAGVAVERALETDPQCPAARLMAELLRRAVPPTAVTVPRPSQAPGAPTPSQASGAANAKPQERSHGRRARSRRDRQ